MLWQPSVGCKYDYGSGGTEEVVFEKDSKAAKVYTGLYIICLWKLSFCLCICMYV